MDIFDRATDANIETTKSLNETTAIMNFNNNATTTTAIVNAVMEEHSKQKRRISVSLDEEIFDKIITVANGKSVSAAMERMLTTMVKDVVIKEDIVEKYKDTMKNKGHKAGTRKKRKRKTNGESNNE